MSDSKSDGLAIGYDSITWRDNNLWGKYLMKDTTIDASRLDQSTWYPVSIYVPPTHNVRIEIEVALDSGTTPSWSTHSGGFSVRKIWETNGSGWGAIPITRNIYVSTYSFADTDPVRGLTQNTSASVEIVYVRGGGKYFFRTSPEAGTPTLNPSGYSWSSDEGNYSYSAPITTTAPAPIYAYAYITVPKADNATKLATARTISLTGSVTGSGTFDGSGNLSISTTTNHTHNYAGSASAGGSANSAVKLDTATAGDSNTPVYFSGGKPVACTSLDLNTSGNAASASKVNNKLTVGSKSYDGSAAVTIAASDLGLASAMLFLGTTTTAITDGATTNPVTIGGSNKTVTAGNVVLYGSKEFVWTGSAWEELGNEGSYKIVQAAVADPSASGTSNTFIDTISQDTNGKITATKKTVAVTNSAPTLAWSTTSTIGTVAGTNLQVKMPANPNTDTKVTQTVTTSDARYPLLLGPSGQTTTTTTTSYFDSGVTLNPRTNTIGANVSGNAATATKLATARTIRTNLASTSTASFDGGANITPGVTGTLPIANGGTGATTASTARDNLGAQSKVLYGNSAPSDSIGTNGDVYIATNGVDVINDLQNQINDNKNLIEQRAIKLDKKIVRFYTDNSTTVTFNLTDIELQAFLVIGYGVGSTGINGNIIMMSIVATTWRGDKCIVKHLITPANTTITASLSGNNLIITFDGKYINGIIIPFNNIIN